jgi:hypothetical protein
VSRLVPATTCPRRRQAVPTAVHGATGYWYSFSRPGAPVAQGIEQRPPEPCAQVRILPGAPCLTSTKPADQRILCRAEVDQMPPDAPLGRGSRNIREMDTGHRPRSAPESADAPERPGPGRAGLAKRAWQIAIDHRGEVRERRADDACTDRGCGHRKCWIEEAHVSELPPCCARARPGTSSPPGPPPCGSSPAASARIAVPS